MFDLMNSLLSDDDFTVVERFELPERPARHAPIPRFLRDSKPGGDGSTAPCRSKIET